MTEPLMIELFSGLHGWADGGVAEGFRVVGFDIVDMGALLGESRPKGVSLVLQDVRTLHGKQFKDAAVIVASPPCTEYSYMAMPWSRSKQIAKALRGQGDFPEGYTGSRTVAELTALFDACFRIQREACEAAGRYIPMVVENVRGAQPWVGRAKAWFGSFYLWGDVGMVGKRVVAGVPKFGVGVAPMNGNKNAGGSWFAIAHNTESGTGKNPVNFPNEHMAQKRNPDGTDHGSGSWFKIADSKNRGAKQPPIPGCAGGWFGDYQAQKLAIAGIKQNGSGREWFAGEGKISRMTSSKSPARKAASAQIARIPFALAHHVAKCFKEAL